eukprot:12550491-Alexandrium_andersonii.AAC.1
MLAPLVRGWQEQLCEAVQHVGELGAWDDPPDVLAHSSIGQHWHAPLPSSPGLRWAGPQGLAPSPLLLYEG